MRCLLLVLGLAGLLTTSAQPQSEKLLVPFLESAPVIDGRPDSSVLSLPVQKFGFTENGDSSNTPPEASFRIAYGTGFLYVCAEVVSDSLVFRDRGYQNGDGMVVVIGKPMPGGAPSREFYVLGFTAQQEGAPSWQKKFIWYRNVDLSMSRLQEAEFCAARGNKKVTFECLIPWSEVYPYHPWLSESIGFNLMVVKGMPDSERMFYYFTADGHIQSEQSPRILAGMEFASPRINAGVQSYAVLSRNNIRTGETVKIRMASCFSKEFKRAFRIGLFSGEHERISGTNLEQKMDKTVTVTEKELGWTSLLQPGGFMIEWYSLTGNDRGSLGLTVLPQASPSDLLAKLEARKKSLSRGSYTTLKFMILDAAESLDKLKPSETSYSLRLQFVEILRILDSPEDVLAARTGVFRRAFLSAVDSTYRPYSIKVPKGLQAGKKYPLIVFLHGSGQDDRDLSGTGLRTLDTGYLVIAPNGRGTSNFYTADHAQEDIEEAVEDAIRNYPVDTSRIVLTGFSMGGYGVYRTFFEHPSRYRALAVFSGPPRILWESSAKGQPDFLEDRYLIPFKGMPMFVFHGSLDRNVQVESTRITVEKLKKLGADVTYVEEKLGHEAPGPAAQEKFALWLVSVTK